MDKAKETLDKSVQNAQNAIAQRKNEILLAYNNAKSEKDADSAALAIDAAKTAMDDAKTAYESATADYDTKTVPVNAYKMKVDELSKTKSDADAKLAIAQQAKTDADEAVASAQKAYNDSGHYTTVVTKEAIPVEGCHVVNIAQKSTTAADGVYIEKCDVCGKVFNKLVMPRIKEVKLAYTSVRYDGKAKKPAIPVKDRTGKVIESYNYEVSYSNNTKAGTATAIVTFMGDYKGTVKLNFKITNATNRTNTITASNITVVAKYVGSATITIKTPATSTVSATSNQIKVTVNPSSTSLSSVTDLKNGKATFKWKNNSAGSGYQIQYAANTGFSKNAKTVTVSSNKTTQTTVSDLKHGTRY